MGDTDKEAMRAHLANMLFRRNIKNSQQISHMSGSCCWVSSIEMKIKSNYWQTTETVKTRVQGVFRWLSHAWTICTTAVRRVNTDYCIPDDMSVSYSAAFDAEPTPSVDDIIILDSVVRQADDLHEMLQSAP